MKTAKEFYEVELKQCYDTCSHADGCIVVNADGNDKIVGLRGERKPLASAVGEGSKKRIKEGIPRTQYQSQVSDYFRN